MSPTLILLYAGYDPKTKVGLYRVRSQERSLVQNRNEDALVTLRIAGHKPRMSFTTTVSTLAYCRKCENHDCEHAMFVQQRTRRQISS